MPRTWQPREMRMVSEWLAKTYPDIPTLQRVRLGAPHPELVYPGMEPEELNMLKVYSRWCDALILHPTYTTIVEAKIRATPAAISFLQLYKKLFLVTPDFKNRWDKPVELLLLYAIEDPVTITLAREQNIRCVHYRPNWLDEYLAELMPRERRAPLTKI